MKQYNLFDLVSSLKQSVLSYVCSSLPLGNHTSQALLGEEFFRRLESDSFRGPYFEAVPSYKKVQSLCELFEPAIPREPCARKFSDLFRPRYAAEELSSRLARAGKCTDSAKKHLENDALRQAWERPLYEHQYRAFQHLRSNQGNLVVSTGTGSGKTECFLLPLLYWLLSESDDQRRQPGVRALLLYPLNALVEDQMRRLRELLSWINGQSIVSTPRLAREVTFGRYVGTTRTDRNDPSPEREDPEDHIGNLGEILCRNEMQQQPPDILITNFTMLEYILLRNDDKRLFTEPGLFRMLVLDEIHSYRGAQGMEVACLLRRFDDLLQRSAHNVKSPTPHYLRVGLSATLPGDLESRRAIAKFASDLFGAPFQESNIITDPRVPSPGEPIDAAGPWPKATDDLLRLRELSPAFCAAFCITALPDETSEPDEIPLEEWQLVAAALESGFIPSGVDVQEEERTELLGRILERSPIVQILRALVRQKEILSIDQLGALLFGQQVEGEKRERALGILLQLVCGGRVREQSLLPLRAHFFVK